MTDMEIMQILTSDMDIFEKGKAFRKAIDAAKPSALNIKPVKERKKRDPRAPKPTTLALTNGADDHAETH